MNTDNLETSPDPIDIQVGENLKRLRIMKDVSQERLGAEVGVTFQQIQKYETGKNRVSASKLARIAAFFEVSLYEFFKGVNIIAETDKAVQLTKKEWRLIRAFRNLETKLQKSFSDMMESAARIDQNED